MSPMGAKSAVASSTIPAATTGILLDPRDHHLARQHPGDYLFGLEQSVRGALAQAVAARPATFRPARSSASAWIPPAPARCLSMRRMSPLALSERWRGNLAAQCWLWKDHTSHREAARITQLAAEHRPQFIAKCGNTYSSEWFWSKIWRCLEVAPDVFEAAYSWVELCDYIPAVLAGVTDPRAVVRGICAAGHKALYHEDWGGLPDKEFLAMLDPKLAAPARPALRPGLRCHHARRDALRRVGGQARACPRASRSPSASSTCITAPSAAAWTRARWSRSSARPRAIARWSAPKQTGGGHPGHLRHRPGAILPGYYGD